MIYVFDISEIEKYIANYFSHFIGTLAYSNNYYDLIIDVTGIVLSPYTDVSYENSINIIMGYRVDRDVALDLVNHLITYLKVSFSMINIHERDRFEFQITPDKLLLINHKSYQEFTEYLEV